MVMHDLNIRGSQRKSKHKLCIVGATRSGNMVNNEQKEDQGEFWS